MQRLERERRLARICRLQLNRMQREAERASVGDCIMQLYRIGRGIRDRDIRWMISESLRDCADLLEQPNLEIAAPNLHRRVAELLKE